MKPLIVYHLMFKDIKGGIHTMATTLAAALADTNGAVLFRVGRWDDKAWRCQRDGGLMSCSKRLRMPWDKNRPIVGFLSWLLEFPRTWGQLVRLLRSEKIEVIHLNGLYDHQLVFYLLARYMGLSCVVTLHGSEILKFSQRTPWQQRVDRWLLARMDGVACVSDRVLQAFKTHMPDIAAEKIENGIDVYGVKEQALNIEQSSLPHLPDDYILMVGHITPVKGHDVAVKAWELVAAKRDDLHLVVVGGEIEVETAFAGEVFALAANGAASKHIHFIGAQPKAQLMALVAGARALLIPSRSEGLPYVMLEAGILGKPLIASDIPPFNDRFRDVSGCFTFASENHEALAGMVLQLSADAAGPAEAGQKLAKVVSDEFSATRMADEYQKLYARKTDVE